MARTDDVVSDELFQAAKNALDDMHRERGLPPPAYPDKDGRYEVSVRLWDQHDYENTLGCKVAISHHCVAFNLEGHGDLPSVDDEGWPVLLEFSEGQAQVIVWADINLEDPTSVIRLDRARVEGREDDGGQ